MNWFGGSTFKIWWRFLSNNKNILKPNNWLKVIFISIQTFRNSRIVKNEKKFFDVKEILSVQLKNPIFILGHWRSGTSHLHNILANDKKFNFPTLLQVTFPNTFFTIQDKIKSRIDSQSNSRPMDNMRITMQSPGEEEVAVWTMCNVSPIGNRLLQNRENHFDKYLNFKNASKEEFSDWKSNFIFFLKKISLNDERQLLLKSPEHTARIKLLLEIFPNAKFINIRRNPFDVFRSTKHLYDKVIKPSYFNKVSDNHLVNRIFLVYKNMYDSYFSDLHLIPKGNFVDICYEDLIAEPSSTIKKIYEELNLDLSETTMDDINFYLDSQKNYKKNEYKDLTQELKERVSSEWEKNFINWGYK